MRYHQAGLGRHHNDTSTIINFCRNTLLILTALPWRYGMWGGTRRQVWHTYFSDLADRMRDANSTIKNLWLMIRDRNRTIEQLRLQVDIKGRALRAVREDRKGERSRRLDAETRIKQLECKVSDLSSSERGLLEQVQLGYSDLAEANKRIEQLEQDRDSLAEELDEMTERHAIRGQRIKLRNARIEQLEQDVDTLAGERDALVRSWNDSRKTIFQALQVLDREHVDLYRNWLDARAILRGNAPVSGAADRMDPALADAEDRIKRAIEALGDTRGLWTANCNAGRILSGMDKTAGLR